VSGLFAKLVESTQGGIDVRRLAVRPERRELGREGAIHSNLLHDKRMLFESSERECETE